MYIASFSYRIKPTDRDRAIELLAQGLAAARTQHIEGWLLIPVTRAAAGGSLVVQAELQHLDQLETFRERALGGEDETRAWLRELSEIMLEPPAVELFRIAETKATPETSGS